MKTTEIKQPLGGNKMHYLSPINLFFPPPPCSVGSPGSQTGAGESGALLKTKGTFGEPCSDLPLVTPRCQGEINRLQGCWWYKIKAGEAALTAHRAAPAGQAGMAPHCSQHRTPAQTRGWARSEDAQCPSTEGSVSSQP